MKLLIGQVHGTTGKRQTFQDVTSILVNRMVGGQPSRPIVAVLQVAPDAVWISSYGDADFASMMQDLSLSQLHIPVSGIIQFPRHLTVQVMQGLRAAQHLADVDHVVVFDDFDQPVALVRMTARDQAWIGRLQDTDFPGQLAALDISQVKLDVDSLDQNDYLTGTTAG